MPPKTPVDRMEQLQRHVTRLMSDFFSGCAKKDQWESKLLNIGNRAIAAYNRDCGFFDPRHDFLLFRIILYNIHIITFCIIYIYIRCEKAIRLYQNVFFSKNQRLTVFFSFYFLLSKKYLKLKSKTKITNNGCYKKNFHIF